MFYKLNLFFWTFDKGKNLKLKRVYQVTYEDFRRYLLKLLGID